MKCQLFEGKGGGRGRGGRGGGEKGEGRKTGNIPTNGGGDPDGGECSYRWRGGGVQ